MLLGGTAVATGLIDGSRLKNRSVPGKKLERNTIGGAQVRESRLRKVPASARADSAATAERAAAAGRADSAARADTAGRADSAATAGTADRAAAAADAAALAGLGPEAFLAAGATAVDADRLDGVDGGDFARGSGVQIVSGSTNSGRVLTVPGFGEVMAHSCFGDNNHYYRNTSDGPQLVWTDSGGPSPRFEPLAAPPGPNSQTDFVDAGATNTDHVVWRVLDTHDAKGAPSVATIHLIYQELFDDCLWSAQAIADPN